MSRRSTLRTGTSRINVKSKAPELSEISRLANPPVRQKATLKDVLQSLQDVDGQRKLSDEDIELLLDVHYTDDEKRPILRLDQGRDPQDIANVYSVMGLIMKSGFDMALTYLRSVSTETDIPFEVPTLRFAFDRLTAEIRALREEIVVSSGLYPCRKCHSKNTMDVQRQTRSGDEALTTFVTCLEKACKYHFKVVATTAVEK